MFKKILLAISIALLSVTSAIAVNGDVVNNGGTAQVQTGETTVVANVTTPFVGGTLAGEWIAEIESTTTIRIFDSTSSMVDGQEFFRFGGKTGWWQTADGGIQTSIVDMWGNPAFPSVTVSDHNPVYTTQAFSVTETSEGVWEDDNGLYTYNQERIDEIRVQEEFTDIVYDAGTVETSEVTSTTLATFETVATQEWVNSNTSSGVVGQDGLDASFVSGSLNDDNDLSFTDNTGATVSVNLGTYNGGVTYKTIGAGSSPWGVELIVPTVTGTSGIYNTTADMINNTFVYQAKYVDGRQDSDINTNTSNISTLIASDERLKDINSDGSWTFSEDKISALGLDVEDYDTNTIRYGKTAQQWNAITGDLNDGTGRYTFKIETQLEGITLLGVDTLAIVSDHEDRITELEARVAALESEKKTIIEQITKVYTQENGDRILVNYSAFTGKMIDVPRKLNFFEFSTPIYSADAVVWHWDADLNKSVLLKRSDIK